jgi:hypothetical protein
MTLRCQSDSEWPWDSGLTLGCQSGPEMWEWRECPSGASYEMRHLFLNSFFYVLRWVWIFKCYVTWNHILSYKPNTVTQVIQDGGSRFDFLLACICGNYWFRENFPSVTRLCKIIFLPRLQHHLKKLVSWNFGFWSYSGQFDSPHIRNFAKILIFILKAMFIYATYRLQDIVYNLLYATFNVQHKTWMHG